MRLVIYSKGERTANIKANKLIREESLMFAYNNENCVGMFDLGAVDMIFLSEDKESSKAVEKRVK